MASLCFFDFETRSDLDLTVTGTLKYVLDPSTQPILLSWAIDDEPVKLWCPNLNDELDPEVWAYVTGRMWNIGLCPSAVKDHAANPTGYFVAWNCGFDRAVWQQIATPDNGFPRIEIEQTLDAMSQGQASNLPGSLDWAGRMLGLGNKTIGGKAIMKRFADRAQPLPGARVLIDAAPDRAKTIKDAIEAWALYLDYSAQDTDLMRAVWKVTRQLDAEEWADYWVSERINDRGMLVDVDVCAGAIQYREEEAAYVGAECARLTDGAIASPTLTKQINEWVFDRLPDDLAETMVKERDEEGYVTRLTGDKGVMGRLLEDIAVSDAPPADEVVELLELLQFGRSSSAVKFQKMLDQSVDNRIYNQYVFNGAGQTHRFSSRGIQSHNLPRAYLDNELDLLDMVAGRVPIEQLRKFGPVNALLAKLIRPTIMAPEGQTLVWADYSAVEARIVAWLAGSRAAEEAVLEPYATGQDLYVLNASAIFRVPIDDVTKQMRQAGKVATLALGFLGSVGALKAMGRGYGMRFSDDDACLIVDGWRDRNGWSRRHGDKIETAMFSAMRQPLTHFKAGRIEYVFVPDLMQGTLAAILPDGRPLVYPMARIEQKEKFGQMRDTITYLNGMGRSSMWAGLAVENATQGLAAGLLRSSLRRVEQEETVGRIVGHTHDEILLEAPVDQAKEVASRLVNHMTCGFDWTGGLPLAAEPAISWYYTKDEKVSHLQ